jgi:hypothetical protein
MKVLLDECLPRKLKREVNAEVVTTVPEAGWATVQNGALLRLAEQEFDVFLTNDQNLEHQQNLKALVWRLWSLVPFQRRFRFTWPSLIHLIVITEFDPP